jgi:23S rRNA (pseudouridine1915-N3)-methyltransferase
MTRLRLLLFEPKRTPWLEAASDTYLEKISALAKFDLEFLKSPKGARDDADSKKRAEAEVFRKALEKGEPYFLFDEKGKAYDSMQFSKFISQQLESGVRRASFLIGGPYGFADEIKKNARGSVSLSEMTMNHHVAQVVVLEQIYRALAIRGRLPYHNE